MPIIIALLVSLFFFMGGCLNLGIYIAQTPREPMEPFIGGLLVGAWPLAVAAVLFMLIDIRLHQNLTAVATETSKEPELAESPMERRSRVTGGKPHREESYFNLNGAPLPKQEPAPVMPQPKSTGSIPSAMVPPAEEAAVRNMRQEQGKKEESGSDLSFFKV